MKKNNEVSHRFTVSPFPRFFLPAILALTLCLAGASGARASLGINLTGGDTWSLPNISPESPHESTTTWTVENTGSEAEDISISAAGTTWTAASATDVNEFILDHNAYSPGTPWKNITTGGVSLKDNLPALETKNFKLQFTAPKSGSDASQTITVTLAANNQWYSGPIATDVAPNQGINTGSISDVVIDGENFDNNATIRLLKNGQTPIDGTSVTVTQGTPDTLEADFNLTGAEAGNWTIELTNPDTGDTSPAKDESGIDCFFGVIPDTWSGACIWKEGDQTCPTDYPTKHIRTVCSGYGVTGGGAQLIYQPNGSVLQSCSGQGCSTPDGGSFVPIYARNTVGTGTCTSATIYTYCCY